MDGLRAAAGAAEGDEDGDEVVVDPAAAKADGGGGGGGPLVELCWSCIDRKYLVAACLSCSRSSAV